MWKRENMLSVLKETIILSKYVSSFSPKVTFKMKHLAKLQQQIEQLGAISSLIEKTNSLILNWKLPGIGDAGLKIGYYEDLREMFSMMRLW